MQNLLLGIIGSPKSTVTKRALATRSGLGSGTATVPIVIGSCHFNPDSDSQNCMPTIAQVPDHEDGTAWTGFFSSGSSLTPLDRGWCNARATRRMA